MAAAFANAVLPLSKASAADKMVACLLRKHKPSPCAGELLSKRGQQLLRHSHGCGLLAAPCCRNARLTASLP